MWVPGVEWDRDTGTTTVTTDVISTKQTDVASDSISIQDSDTTGKVRGHRGDRSARVYYKAPIFTVNVHNPFKIRKTVSNYIKCYFH